MTDGRLLSRRAAATTGASDSNGSSAMAKIRTFARIKPGENLYDDYETTRHRLYLRIPDSYGRDSTLYNRTRAPIVNHEFKYSQVFNTDVSQEEVFNISAKNIIDGFLEGYNGTIFAYGQTSSGKTYTMHGDLMENSNRGLAPRSLTHMFAALNARKEAGENITVHCSFLEIYQEVGYDLLKTTNKSGPGLTSFAKVTVVDGPQGAAVVKNLSVHAINTEEAAQAMLAQGEMNRKVAETAMNNRSSRSHAVFTVYVSSRKGDLLVRSKMHFVDLAGSERVCKTGVKGLQLSEAKYINLSLHYLEGVIIALHQDATGSGRGQTAAPNVGKSWSASTRTNRPYSAAVSNDRPRHIPYRNSLLTMLLKDSLGGNCLTTMIATISLEMTNLSESISTCRFAQRVSCISNTARKNEEIDDKSMIKRLRTRVAELEAENSILKHGGQPDELSVEDLDKPSLTQEDRTLCQNVVKDFLNGRLMDPIVAGVKDPFKFRECMVILKKLIKESSDKALRLTEKLKSQPSHIQEAFYTGGRYHEAPLAKPSRRQDITFRDDANHLARNAYRGKSSNSLQRHVSPFKPTILKSASPGSRVTSRGVTPGEAWQLQLHDVRKSQGSKKKQVRIEIDPQHEQQSSSPSIRAQKPQSAGAALYRSPYPHERKKVHEITKLNKKVEANYAQQLEETNHLKIFKQSVAEQECEVAIESLKRKLEVTQHQLADQHAYITKLRKQSSDDDLIEQEMLVERQLQKRTNRIDVELKNAHVMLERMRASESQENSQSPSYRSVQDKFAGMTKKDGSMNTYKVKSELEQQQRLQNQIQKKIEQQRALVIEKSLEVKELSTRQRLEEFKRKLAESQQGKPNTPPSQKPPELESTIHETKQVHALKSDVLSKNVTQVPKSSIFQHRRPIEHEKPQRERSIDRILSKYRVTGEETGDSAHARERSAQVDKILAKYNQGKIAPEMQTVSKDSKVSNVKDRRNKDSSKKSRQSQIQPQQQHQQRVVNNKSSSPSSEQDSGYNSSATPEYREKTRWTPSSVSRVRVPNSAMEYNAARINSGHQGHHIVRETVNQDIRQRPAAENFKSEDRSSPGRQRNFEATLKSMLNTRQGHHSRRTDAWSTDLHQAMKTVKGEDKDQLKKKLKQFLSEQQKKKVQSGSKVRERSRSRTRETNAMRSKTAHANKVTSAASNRQSRRDSKTSIGDRSRSERTTDREFSHRISHYQNSSKSNKRLEVTGIIHRESSLQEKQEPTEKQLEESTPSITQEQPVFHTPNNLGGLQKLSRRNEYTSKIREIQNAASKIQRAWRNHCKKTTKVRRY